MLEWILNIGYGEVGKPNDVEANVQIVPYDILIDGVDYPITTIVESTYRDLKDYLSEPSYFQ